jgi:hypothetical protein
MAEELNDVQNSLAVALARIEVERLRCKRLLLENVHLRNVLRNHGLNPGKEIPATPAPASDLDVSTMTASTQTSPVQTPLPAEIVYGGCSVRSFPCFFCAFRILYTMLLAMYYVLRF